LLGSADFAKFCGYASGLTRSVRCFLRITRDREDSLNHLIAGFCGGLAFKFSENTDFSLWFAAKSLESLWSLYVAQGRITPLPHGEVLLFSSCIGLLFYAVFFEPHNVRPSYFKYLIKASEPGLREVWHANTPLRHAAGIPAPELYAQWFDRMRRTLKI
jgi:hypothetical protein